MYDTLRPELLTATPEQRQMMADDPTAVVSRELFFENQFPYMELRRPFILGTGVAQWKATRAHWFIRLLEDKGKLARLYTQNIDGLDFQTGISSSKLVSVHGTMHSVHCEGCGADYPRHDFVDAVKASIKDIYAVDPSAPLVSRTIPCLDCGKPLVKPSTVLYGGSMPSAFFQAVKEDFPASVDLLLVMGTSLTVMPAASLVNLTGPNCRRVIVDRNPVAYLQHPKAGEGANLDFFLEGDCEDCVTELVNALHWEEDLQRLLNAQ